MEEHRAMTSEIDRRDRNFDGEGSGADGPGRAGDASA